ncbi:MAG TPA: efflux RND transporter periplasmic adaptor subunit [Bryobacteraceae bacterium]|nr:efflux RND transporter periplasmic adaptor subunit [Bryobacteraceae bacterium]
MRLLLRGLVTAALLVLLGGCSRPGSPVAEAASAGTVPAASTASVLREVRLTGIVEAVHYSKVLVPAIYGQGGALTLTHLIPNGSQVKEGDPIAEFDATTQADNARDAQAKFDDLGHQAEQKRAQNRADAEKRAADLKQAEADLAKAELELQKGPLLAEIDRLKNEAKAELAREHVASLNKSNAAHDRSDAAALKILELQRDRQKVALERARNNMQLLSVKASLAGVVAHQNVYRNNSVGHPQEGDQLWRGQAIVSIFDPSKMLVRCAVGEPDGAVLVPGSKATVYLDAYPDLSFPAHFESASPVASSALGSPIKTFTAVFALDASDAHLMPDLSASVVVKPPTSASDSARAAGGGN